MIVWLDYGLLCLMPLQLYRGGNFIVGETAVPGENNRPVCKSLTNFIT